MLLFLCWTAFVSTLTLTIAEDLNWIFPVMFFLGFVIAAIKDPDGKKNQAKKSDSNNSKEEIKNE